MMNGHIENNGLGILKFILNNQEHFINVFDRFENDFTKIPDSLECINLSGSHEIDSLLIYTDEGRFYPFIKEKFIKSASEIIDGKDKIFTLYGDELIIKKILKNLNRSITSYNDYHVMMLTRSVYPLSINAIEGYRCLRCNELSFNRLKDLQYAYHMEEVYSNNLNYPYYVEMSAYKKLLKEKLNYSVFSKDKDIAVSKANVNGESPDFFQLGGIFTRNEFRQKGLSKLCLFNMINDIFESTDKKGILLFVNIENKPAINLYNKIGFKIIFNTTLCYF